MYVRVCVCVCVCVLCFLQITFPHNVVSLSILSFMVFLVFSLVSPFFTWIHFYCYCQHCAKCKLQYLTDLHMARLMLLPLRCGFTFLVLAHLGSTGKGLLNGCCCCCCGELHKRSLVKIWGDLLMRFHSYGSLNFRESDYL